MLVGGVERCVHAKVHTHSVAHDRFTIERLPYLDSRFCVKEGDYYPAKRLKWRPSVNFCMLVYRFAELRKGGNVEDVSIEEVLQSRLDVTLECREANIL